MSSVLIAGCGYVGTRLAEKLLMKGVTVYGLRRSITGLPRGVRGIRADLTELDTIELLPQEISKVVYCAAASSHDEESYRAIYVHGLQNLLRVIRESGCSIERFLYVSSTGVYAQANGELVNEDSPTEPANFTGKILLDGEERALRTSFPSTIVRFSGIYGPRRTPLAKLILSGQAACYLGVPQISNCIHQEDCAGILDYLLHSETELEPVYLASDEEPVDRGDLLRFLAGCLNAPMPPLLSANEAPRRLHGGNKRIDSSKIRALGYSFTYPTFRQGYPPLCAQLLEES